MATVTSTSPPLQRLKPQRHILVLIHSIRAHVREAGTGRAFLHRQRTCHSMAGGLKEKTRLPSPEAATLYVPRPRTKYLPIAHFPVFPFLVLA